MKLLEGQTAIVTGAGRGIGVAIARELAMSGANIVVNYRKSAQGANALMRELSEYGGKHIAVQADVADFDEAHNMVRIAHETYGRIDILINNAGVNRDRTLKNMTYEQWDDVIRTNLYSVFNCTKAVLPHMLERKHGRIVSISSFAAQAGNVGQSNYAATKAGMIGFTKSVALETSRHGITVNIVAPGFTETDMLWDVPENIRDRIMERIPMNRFGTSEEIAKCVRFIVSEGDYMTAQVISINGGAYI